MADDRRFDLEDVLLRPGCYLNPQTEIMVVVDDSPSIDGEIFNMEEFEGADWVLIADEVPVDDPLAGPGEKHRQDAALRLEVRQLVIARNERRAARGEPPLDVDLEVERQIADLNGL